MKYEHGYLHAYESVIEARQKLGDYFSFYNTERPHSALGGSTPDTAYFGQLESKKGRLMLNCEIEDGRIGGSSAAGTSLKETRKLS